MSGRADLYRVFFSLLAMGLALGMQFCGGGDGGEDTAPNEQPEDDDEDQDDDDLGDELDDDDGSGPPPGVDCYELAAELVGCGLSVIGEEIEPIREMCDENTTWEWECMWSCLEEIGDDSCFLFRQCLYLNCDVPNDHSTDDDDDTE